ncbi:hypothetical protein GCM10010415_64960 [Streptomyces atrovirens]
MTWSGSKWYCWLLVEDEQMQPGCTVPGEGRREFDWIQSGGFADELAPYQVHNPAIAQMQGRHHGEAHRHPFRPFGCVFSR